MSQKQIRNQFPVVYEECVNYLKISSNNKLGYMQPVKVCDGHYVCNLYGQLTYGRTGQHTCYEALERALEALQDFALSRHIKEVALPYKIGCGLAGGDWNVVHGIIEKVFQHVDVVLYKL